MDLEFWGVLDMKFPGRQLSQENPWGVYFPFFYISCPSNPTCTRGSPIVQTASKADNLQVEHLGYGVERDLRMNKEWLHPIIRKLSRWGRLAAQRNKLVLNSRYNLHLPRLATKFSRCGRKVAEQFQFHRQIPPHQWDKMLFLLSWKYFFQAIFLLCQQIQIIPHMLKAAMHWMFPSVPSALSIFQLLIKYINSKSTF